MNHGLSDQVRAQAKVRFVQPAIISGRRQFSISVKEFLRELEAGGFPANHARQVCKALSSGKFQRENNIELDGIDGPPSKTSTTVVLHYRHDHADAQIECVEGGQSVNSKGSVEETPEEWAHRMTGKLFGLMKEEFAGFGGGEAFLRWVRSEDESDAR